MEDTSSSHTTYSTQSVLYRSELAGRLATTLERIFAGGPSSAFFLTGWPDWAPTGNLGNTSGFGPSSSLVGVHSGAILCSTIDRA